MILPGLVFGGIGRWLCLCVSPSRRVPVSLISSSGQIVQYYVQDLVPLVVIVLAAFLQIALSLPVAP